MSTNMERKSTHAGADGAKRFFAELLESVESLGSIADEFGLNTLTDLMYLQNAILVGDQIDVWPGETHVGQVLEKLPSADQWLSYTKLGGDWAHACERAPQASA